MLWISPRRTLHTMISLLILPPIGLGFGAVIHRWFERIQEQFADLSTFVQEGRRTCRSG